MNKLLPVVLLLSSASAWAQKPAPDPASYTVAVHVYSSQLAMDCHDSWSMSNPGGLGKANHCGIKQRLGVVISGKKYELEGKDDTMFVLRTGDYKARMLLEDLPASTPEYQTEIELLLPNERRHVYRVVGESE
jgi:hypothetical protein